METLVFLMLIALGGFVQTITGFAMGLIVMGGVALLGLIELASAAAVVSIVSLVNVVVALRRNYRYIHWPIVSVILLGMFPLVFVGVSLLEFLSNENQLMLKVFLGVVIVTAGLLLISKPHPYEQHSGKLQVFSNGMAAGLMSGMYGAGGAPIAYLMYRQPMLLQAVRASLLSIFALSTIVRTGFVAVEGHLTSLVGYLIAWSIPVIVLATLLGGKLAPLVPDALVRKLALWLLILIGLTLIGSGVSELFF